MHTDTMAALVKTGKGKGLIEVREVPVPTIGEDEVLIEIKAAGICGTDLHIYHDEFPYWPPVILGHEFSGVIAARGKNVKGWSVGDRVVGEPHTLACGTCWLCRSGHRQLCPSKRSPGWGIDGCFARYMRFPEPGLLHEIPVTLGFEEAALIEPIANVVTDVLENGDVRPGETVVVVGPGPIGLLAAQAARAAGAGPVIVVGTDADEEIRLPTARTLFPAGHVLNVQREDALERIMQMTRGRGADLAVEASGAEKGIGFALQALRKLGRLTAIGLTGRKEIAFPYDAAMFKAVRFVFNLSTSYTSWDTAIRLVADGKMDPKPLITHRGGIERWQDFFADLDNKKGLKGLFLP